MLLIEIADTWRHLEPDEVVEGILSGKLHRETPAREFARGSDPERIESVLGPEHLDALSAKLLRSVRSIMSAEEANDDDRCSFGLGRLKDRVVELSHWDLTAQHGRRAKLRLTWLSAWLTELLGRNLEAIEQYTAFLRLRPMKEEQGLYLLARNNRAVLLLRQGRLRAVRDLARVALTTRLPGACFSLLNVINVARGDGTLSAIDLIIMSVLNRLPVAERLYWTGPEDDETDSSKPATANDGAQRSVAKATARTLCGDPAMVSHLIVALVRHAIHIGPAAVEGFRPDRPGAKPSDGLELWSQPPELLVAPLHGADPPGDERHAAYYEAVSLLYPRDLPPGLYTPSPRTTEAEARAEERIGRAIKELDQDHLEPARETLLAVKALLADKPAGSKATRLLAEVERYLKSIELREKRVLDARFQEGLSELETEVQAICEIDDLSKVESRSLLVLERVRSLRDVQRKVLGDEKVDFTKALVRRLEQHADSLRAKDQENKLKTARQRLEQLMPSNVRNRVSPEAYSVLKLCREADPARTPHWDELEEFFQRHDARCFFQQALDQLYRGGVFDNEQVEGLLMQALALDHTLAPQAAPLIALLHLPVSGGESETFDEIREELVTRAQQLVEQPMLDKSRLLRPAVRREVIADAVKALRRVSVVLLSREQDLAAVAKLTKSLDTVFESVLARGTPEDIEAVAEILRQWQPVCEDWYDPRHPLHSLQSKVTVHALLAQARRHLQASHPAEAKAAVEQAFPFGFTSRDQLCSAAVLYAVARPLPGPRPRQERILNALESRVSSLSDEACAETSVATVENWLSEIDPNLAPTADSPPPLSSTGAAGGAPAESSHAAAQPPSNDAGLWVSTDSVSEVMARDAASSDIASASNSATPEQR